MNRNITKLVVLLLTLLMPSVLMAQSCTTVLTHTWRWWSNLAQGDDTTSGWGAYPATYSYIIDNKSATYINTDLDIGLGPNGEGYVKFLNADFGMGAPDAWARVWSGSHECTSVSGNNRWADNGTCYPGIFPADKGRITFNDYEMGSQSLGLNSLIVLHETGHIFGMKHMPQVCSNTFMVPDPYVGQSESLDTYEVNWLNSTY